MPSTASPPGPTAGPTAVRRHDGRQLSRRHFLVAATGLFAAAVGDRAPAMASRSAVIGVQLYTVRTLLERDFDGTLAALARIGFREVEFAGYHGRSPQAVRAALDHARLVAPSAHVPIDAARDELPRALDAALVMGHRHLVIAWLPEAQPVPQEIGE